MDKNEISSPKNVSLSRKVTKRKGKMQSAKSYKNVKKLVLNNLSSIKDSGVTTTGNSTTNKSGMTKFQSAIDIKNNGSSKNVLRESSSLKPFPKIDPEFYTEKKNYFWQREMNKIRSEKTIFSQKTALKKQLSQKNNKMVYESQIFKPIDTIPKKKMNVNTTKNVTVDLSKPLQKSLIAIQRERNFHCNVSVTNPSTSRNFDQPIKTKTVSPMHLKLYESSMSKNSVQKVYVPKSHPSYNKDPIDKPKVTPSTRKRLEFLKTSYNFTKSYI